MMPYLPLLLVTMLWLICKIWLSKALPINKWTARIVLPPHIKPLVLVLKRRILAGTFINGINMDLVFFITPLRMVIKD